MLYRNDVFSYEGHDYRLLDVAASVDQAWAIRVDDEFAWPEQFQWTEIAALDPNLSEITPSCRVPSKAAKERRDAALSRIKPLLMQIPSIYESKLRGPMVERRAQELRCSERTLHKNLRCYWQGGQTPDALLANYHRSGRKDGGITAGRGRPPLGDHSVFQLSADDLEYFKNSVETHYLKDSRISISAAYQRLLERHYAVLDGNGQMFIRSFGERPTLRQYSHYLRTNYPLEARLRGREGNKDFERDHRSKIGTVTTDCLGVGHYYEIDATIADVYLVSSEDVNKIIGKPTLYLIIDRKSRLIVGFYVGLENACWIGAMEAILSIAQDKRELCARYGARYNPEDWPAHEVFPKEFLADRGEMLSKASAQVCDGLQITVTSVPSMRPDWKPLVESSFKLIHEAIKDVAPAYDPPSNAMRRRGKHYEKDACLTLNGFGRIILEAIIAHNRRAMANYELNVSELTSGLQPIPIELWNRNIVERSGLLTRFPEARIRYALLPRDNAAVTAEGIVFRNCYYSCKEAVAKGWFVSARKKRFKIAVSYDSRLVDKLYIHSPDGSGHVFEATLTSRSEMYRGYSFAEVKYYETLRSMLRPAIEQNRVQTRMEFHQHVDPITKAAKKKLRSEGTAKSRSARRADTKQERLMELRAERNLLASHPRDCLQSTDLCSHSIESNVLSLPLRGTLAPTIDTQETTASPPEMTAQQKLQNARRKMLNGY